MTAKATPPVSSRKERAKPGNTRFWDAVCETDPAHTTKINQRGGFTAICAQYQRHQATKLWGPEGEGWEVDAKYDTLEIGDTTLAIVDLQLKWREKTTDEWRKCQPQRGASVLNAKGRIDTDAFKKAGTDAMTASLAKSIGFNADVFLGKFDDNKYVAEMKRKHSAPPAQAPERTGKQIADDIADVALVQPLRDVLVALDPAKFKDKQTTEIAAQFKKRAADRGIPFNKAFIDEQVEEAQNALMRKAGK